MTVLTAVLAGVPLTILLTALSFAIGVVGGVPLALARRSSHFVPRAIARASRRDFLRGIGSAAVATRLSGSFPEPARIER